jgi:adenosylhomocysteine nucleosidase
VTPHKIDTGVLISAGAEWRALLPHFPQADVFSTPYGEAFTTTISGDTVAFLHGGWGKVAAAASTQYTIDRWAPARVINLGTCGGLAGYAKRGEVFLASKTLIYDIIEGMTDSAAAIHHYSVEFDLSWLPDPPPQPVTVGTILSADRDILPAQVPELVRRFNASVADWESGAIAWVARRNQVPCLILRAVSDLVDETAGEAYGNYAYFEAQCEPIMADFARHLPAWLEVFK